MSTDFSPLNFLNNTSHWYLHNDSISPEQEYSSHILKETILFSMTFSEKKDSYTLTDMMQMLIHSLNLTHVLILWLIDHTANEPIYYIGLVPDDDNCSDHVLIDSELKEGQELLNDFFEDGVWGIELHPIGHRLTASLIARLDQYPFASGLSGMTGMLVHERLDRKIALFQKLCQNSSYVVSLLFRAIQKDSITDIATNTGLLADTIQTYVSRSRTRIYSSTTSCASNSMISGSVSRSNSSSHGNDRRESVIDIENDDDQEFWTPNPEPSDSSSSESESSESESSDSTSSDSAQSDSEKSDSTAPGNENAESNASAIRRDNSISRGRSRSHGESCTSMKAANDSCSKGQTNSTTHTCSNSEFVYNYNARDWADFIDNNSRRRYALGLNTGIYLCNMTLFSGKQCCLSKLGGCLSNILSNDCHFCPCHFLSYDTSHPDLNYIRHLQMPYSKQQCCESERSCRYALSQYSEADRIYHGSLINGYELAFILSILLPFQTST